MKVSATIQDIKTGEITTVSKDGANRTKTLLYFMWEAKKYADKDHKVLRLSTDDMTIFSELKQHYPTWNIDLLEAESDTSPEGAD